MQRHFLEQRFEAVWTRLSAVTDEKLLGRRFSSLIMPRDRHLPRSLFDLTLRDIIGMNFLELMALPSLGAGRLGHALIVLERVLQEPPPFPEPVQAVRESPGLSSDPVWSGLDFEDFPPALWSAWGEAIRAHRLEHDPLGRYAPSLRELSSAQWSVPVGFYLGMGLGDLRRTAGLGPSRLTEILRVYEALIRAIGPRVPEGPLRLRPVHRSISEAVRFCDSLVGAWPEDGEVELVPGLFGPLFDLLENDGGVEIADIVRRRIGVDGPAETLDQIAKPAGVTRERIRQLALRAAEIMRVRWPEGRFRFEEVKARFQSAGCSEAQARLIEAAAGEFFGKQTAATPLAAIFAAWERAGREKRTPMDEKGVRDWADETFPGVPPDDIVRALHPAKVEFGDSRGELYFSGSPSDRILRFLHDRKSPVPASELAKHFGGAERNLKVRIESDPRILDIEGEGLTAAEIGGDLVRGPRGWTIRLESANGVPPKLQSIAVGDLIGLVVGGLIQAGIADATVWGVHRFADRQLAALYGGQFPRAISPFILANTLIVLSGGLINSMRRRRLRWDTADGSIPVRGKWGWVDEIARRAGQPITVDELDRELRSRYQDYEIYVLTQLDFDFKHGEAEAGTRSFYCRSRAKN